MNPTALFPDFMESATLSLYSTSRIFFNHTNKSHIPSSLSSSLSLLFLNKTSINHLDLSHFINYNENTPPHNNHYVLISVTFIFRSIFLSTVQHSDLHSIVSLIKSTFQSNRNPFITQNTLTLHLSAINSVFYIHFKTTVVSSRMLNLF